MSKRSFSPQDLPASKRLHTSHAKPLNRHLSFVASLYDELLLTIFSYLSWVDLCAAQLINREWARLASDNELWRKQYLLVYGRSRLRGSRGFTGRFDGREVRSLPARARTDGSAYRDWKWMFRISSNWRRGRCSVDELPRFPNLGSSQNPSGHSDDNNPHLLLTGPLTITTSSQPSYEPTIYVHDPATSYSVICKPRHTVCCSITALAVDQSPPASSHTRLVSFLTTGEFFGYQLQHNPPSPSLEVFSFACNQRSHPHPVVRAVYHHPLLVTLSGDFAISLYNLESDTARLTQTLSSFTSFPPVSLVLSTPSPSTYKLILTYAIPVYPQHWTAGATELIISGPRMVVASGPNPPTPSDSSPSLENPSRSENLAVLSTRTARAVDVPFGWIDERKLRIMREQWCRKVNRVADIQTDGKWLILAPGDQLSGLENGIASLASPSSPSYPPPMSKTNNTHDIAPNSLIASPLHSPTNLQLYRLIFPSQNSISSSPPRLSYVRTLHGQTGPIAALALSDGRCVSLSLNGSIWVWDLEAGTGAQVAAASLKSADGLLLGPDAKPIRGSVSFDERRLIITLGDNVVVRRFDV
ncbi:hypothetical protein P691DRAFT_662064 [Macrolepiota fuliginosa MF-IS2]|uniref:F-box domain-containing protein n=1 Tax=Macrolepiota fuliginosa MF-IS2 TaxID=1400762 RepID=A0A9P5XLY2_9AGAR|nr:hypothetical protein P691DRAFT_662064 [Macrolepiota fuliginosa MF-IS2]